MNRMKVGQLSTLLLGFCLFLLISTNVAWGQTTTQTTTPPPAKPKPTAPAPAKPAAPAAAKPATQPAAAKPATQSNAKPTSTTPASPASAAKTPTMPAPTSPANPAKGTIPASPANPAATSNVLPARGTSTAATPSTPVTTATAPSAGSSASAAASNSVPGAATTGQPAAANPGNALLAGNSGAAGTSNGRSALTTQGVGSFHWGDFGLTAYGCYRVTTRILCDFDITKQNSVQMNLGAFYNVAVVDDGGKITGRHDAYYLASDGSHLTVAYLSPAPVRYIMEYDSIDANISSVSLIFGNDRMQGVPITAGDLSASGSGTGGRGPASGSGSSGSTGGASGAAGDPRAALAAQGLGTFRGADFTLTAYGCYRTDTRILCDFDITKQNSAQVNTSPFYTVAVVDDGGKITSRHDAYYLGTDGTHLTAVYLSTTPTRYVMEYDNVGAQFTSVSLINGNDQIQAVPITVASASQPAGTIPNRGGAPAAGTTTAQNQPGAPANGANPANATDQATTAVNKANDAKKKAKGILDQLKSLGSKPQ